MKKTYTFFSYLGGPGALMSNPGERKFQGSKTSQQSRQFLIYGPQYRQMCIFGYSGDPGWPINNRTGPILLPSYHSTYEIWKQSDKDFLSYRENDVKVSADADAA